MGPLDWLFPQLPTAVPAAPQALAPVPTPAQAPQAPEDAWGSFLKEPGNRAMMMQVGLQLMQPVALGQNWLGHLGQAVGSGAEAKERHVGAVEKQEKEAIEQRRKDQEFGLDERRVAAQEKLYDVRGRQLADPSLKPLTPYQQLLNKQRTTASFLAYANKRIKEHNEDPRNYKNKLTADDPATRARLFGEWQSLRKQAMQDYGIEEPASLPTAVPPPPAGLPADVYDEEPLLGGDRPRGVPAGQRVAPQGDAPPAVDPSTLEEGQTATTHHNGARWVVRNGQWVRL